VFVQASGRPLKIQSRAQFRRSYGNDSGAVRDLINTENQALSDEPGGRFYPAYGNSVKSNLCSIRRCWAYAAI